MKLTAFQILIIVCLLATSCKPELESPEYSLGDINASTIVSIGTASSQGYMNDALYNDGQTNSFPNILAQQIGRVSNVTFEQSLTGSSIGVNLKGESRLTLGHKTDCKGVTSLSPLRISATGDNSIISNNIFNASKRIQNFGIENVRITEVDQVGYGDPANGAGNYNPFYYRIASAPTISSILSDAVAINPTFFTFCMGEYDLLEYAASGGTGSPITPSYGPNGTGFDGSSDHILQQLTSNGSKGAVANIPDVSQFPFFTTIPYDGLTLSDDQATTLNNIYVPMGTGISFQAGSNPFAIEDNNEPFNVRLIQEGELILLSVPLDSIKCKGMGSIVPIPNRYVLTLDELDSIQTAMNEYNMILKDLASNYNLAFVDLHSLFTSITNGITYNGIDINAEFVSGGAFSLDGKHTSALGNALIANKFIQTINAKYNANIPLCDPGDYKGVEFP